MPSSFWARTPRIMIQRNNQTPVFPAGHPYMRVACCLHARFRRAAPGESQMHRRAPENPGVKELAGGEPGLPPALVKLLLAIDAKLNILLGRESLPVLYADFPGNLVVTGLGPEGFVAQARDLRHGDLMEAVILLGPDCGMASGLAVVEKALTQQDADASSHAGVNDENAGQPSNFDPVDDTCDMPVWFIRWTSIREGDHEELMRHIFSEERQHIRLLRQRD